jgi:sugar lactone lactonase YvrE
MMATCAVDCRNTLGEGCFWDPREGCLYWTDIEERLIYRLQSNGEVSKFTLPERAGFILPRRNPGFVIGFPSRIALCDSTFHKFTTVAVIEPDLEQTRVNDAAVDPYGGLVFGTFDERDRRPVAGLYRLSPTGEVTQLLEGVAISNGLAFSPDGTLMYFADTSDGIIRRFRVGSGFQTLQEIDCLAGADIAPGKPDGAVVDSEGCSWNARVWGGCVVRISPDGYLLDKIDIPAKGPTCVAMGGVGLTRLFATTLRIRHTAEELESMPLAGGLFCVDVAVGGASQRLCRI